MRRFLQGIVAVARDGGPDADVAAQQAANDRLVHNLYGLTAAKIAAVEKVGPS